MRQDSSWFALDPHNRTTKPLIFFVQLYYADKAIYHTICPHELHSLVMCLKFSRELNHSSVLLIWNSNEMIQQYTSWQNSCLWPSASLHPILPQEGDNQLVITLKHRLCNDILQCVVYNATFITLPGVRFWSTDDCYKLGRAEQSGLYEYLLITSNCIAKEITRICT